MATDWDMAFISIGSRLFKISFFFYFILLSIYFGNRNILEIISSLSLISHEIHFWVIINRLSTSFTSTRCSQSCIRIQGLSATSKRLLNKLLTRKVISPFKFLFGFCIIWLLQFSSYELTCRLLFFLCFIMFNNQIWFILSLFKIHLNFLWLLETQPWGSHGCLAVLTSIESICKRWI